MADSNKRQAAVRIPPIFSGWLLKRPKKSTFSLSGTWKRRYCALERETGGAGAPFSLKFYTGKGCDELKGEVPVDKSSACVQLDSAQALGQYQLPKDLLGRHLLCVVPSAQKEGESPKPIVLEAESEEQVKHWISSLSEAIVDAASLKTSSKPSQSTSGPPATLFGGKKGGQSKRKKGGLLSAFLHLHTISEKQDLTLWQKPAFIDIFADAFLPRHQDSGTATSETGHLHIASALKLMLQTLNQIKTEQWMSKDVSRQIFQAFSFAEDTLKDLPLGSGDAVRFEHFLLSVLKRVRALEADGLLVLPGGWESDRSRHCLLYVLHRRQDTFSFYGMVYPGSCVDGAETLYGTLLPYLSGRPVSQCLPLYPHETEWTIPPQGGDLSCAHCVLEAVRLTTLCITGCHQQARDSQVLVAWAVMQQARDLLPRVPALSPADAWLLKQATRHLADLAGQRACHDATTLPAEALAEILHTTEVAVDAHVEGVLGRQRRPPPPLALSRQSLRTPAAMLFPHFGRLRRDTDVEGLAGDAKRPPILLPIEMTLVTDVVTDFTSAGCALRHAVQLCGLLANQSHLVKNSASLRVSLVQHLMTRVLPLPLPLTHPNRAKQCYWAAQPMRRETQVDLLRLLNQLSRHYAAAALSLKADRTLDAARILTLAACAAVADAVLRVRACDVPSAFSMHYSGEAPGPVQPFGVHVGSFLQESEYLQLTSPEYAVALSQVLEYFTCMQGVVPAECMLFRFDRGMEWGEAEARLLRHVCLQTAMEHADGLLPLYLCGEEPAFLDAFPELGFFRDITFMLKARPCAVIGGDLGQGQCDSIPFGGPSLQHVLQAPTATALPEPRSWRPRDAVLGWQFEEAERGRGAGRFIVRGFGRKLECAGEEAEAEEWGLGALFNFRRFGGAERPRCPPSGANPSNLVGQRIDTEADVLQLREMPDFGGRLRAQDAELLLQYLTAPYLRVPLVLGFFASPERVLALQAPQLQAVLDACLFEPGAWQPSHEPACPEMVPCLSREHLRSPCGLLFNELKHSPQSVVQPVLEIVDHTLEQDTGRYGTGAAELLLYATRLVVRVEGYLLFMMRNTAWVHEAKPDALEVVGPALLVAHIYLNTSSALDEEEAGRGKGGVKTAKGKEGADAEVAGWSALGIPPMELFDLFQKHRGAVLTWLQTDAKARSELLEALLQDVTHAGEKLERGPAGEAEGTRRRGSHTRSGSVFKSARGWQSMTQPGCVGRFVPDTELLPASLDDELDFQEWLRRSTRQSANLEINVQLGELTVKKNRIQTMDRQVAEMSDFGTVLGRRWGEQASMQCAEVKNTTHRTWLRLAGKRHDLQVWTPDTRPPKGSGGRKYSEGKGLHAGEKWIQQAVQQVYPLLLPPGMKLFLPLEDCSACTCVRIEGLVEGEEWGPAGAAMKELVVYQRTGAVHVYDVISHGRRFMRSLVFASDSVSCLHDGSSSPMESADGSTRSVGRAGEVNPGDVQPSLVITRTLSVVMGMQTFMPRRFLQGILPAALLERYEFWQHAHDGLTGYLLPPDPAGSSQKGGQRSLGRPSRIDVHLVQRGPADESGHARSEASAWVQRVMLLESAWDEDEPGLGSEADAAQPVNTLVNLLSLPARPDTSETSWAAMGALATLLGRVEDLSHCLVWTSAPVTPPSEEADEQELFASVKKLCCMTKEQPPECCGVDLVELPRLRLTFRAKQ
eukprot:gene1789-2455_t